VLFLEESFGKNTYDTLLMFNNNANNIKRMIELYWNILNLDDILKNNKEISDKELLDLKHMILLDSIARIQSLIETLLILLDSLESGYSHVASNVAFYPFKKPRQIIENFRKKKYNSKLRLILGLPDIGKLNLEHSERRILIKVWEKTIDEMKRKILDLGNFYDLFRIIWKMEAWLDNPIKRENLSAKFDNSIILVNDNKSFTDMPIGSLKANDKNNFSSDWFNAQSIIPVNDKLFKFLKDVLIDLIDVINFVTNNHIYYAHNCGMTYIPYFELNKEEYIPWLYNPENLSKDEKKSLDIILSKLLDQTYIIKPNLSLIKTYNSLIKESIESSPITNIWISNSKT
jgi:hypothetical protein